MPRLPLVGFGNVAKSTEKRDDKASFVAFMFPYKHDRREYIVEING
jgi:hypothetical protein